MIDIFINNQIYKILGIVLLCLSLISFVFYQYVRYMHKKKRGGKFIEHVVNFAKQNGEEAILTIAKKIFMFLIYIATLMLCFILYTITIIEVQLAVWIFQLFCNNSLSHYFAFLTVITINWFTSFWPFCKILDYCKNNEIVEIVKSYMYNWIKTILFLLAILVVIFFNDVGKINSLESNNIELYDIALRAFGSSILVAIIIDRFIQHLKAGRANNNNIREKNKKECVIGALNNYRDNLKEKLSEDEMVLLNSYIFHLKLAVCCHECFEPEEIAIYIDKLRCHKKGIDIYLPHIEEFFKCT